MIYTTYFVLAFAVPALVGVALILVLINRPLWQILLAQIVVVPSLMIFFINLPTML